MRTLSTDCSPNGELTLTAYDDGSCSVWTSSGLFKTFHFARYHPSVNYVFSSEDAVLRFGETSCEILSMNRAVRVDRVRYQQRFMPYGELCHSFLRSPCVSSLAPIEVFAMSPRNDLYFCAHSHGKLRLCGLDGAAYFTRDAKFTRNINLAAWSRSGDFLAFTDDLNRLHIQDIHTSCSSWPTEYQLDLTEQPNQIMFHDDETLILVVTAGSISWHSFQNPAVSARTECTKLYRWLRHPLRSDLLLGLCCDTIYLLNWKGLQPVTHITLCLGACSCNTAKTEKNVKGQFPQRRVVEAYTSSDGFNIVLRIELEEPGELELFVIRTTAIDAACATREKHLIATRYPHEVSTSIIWPLGFILDSDEKNNGKFAFIDKNGSLCTFDQDEICEYSGFLPLSWMDPASLCLAHVSPDGILYLPKDGDVGIIKNCFRSVLARRGCI